MTRLIAIGLIVATFAAVVQVQDALNGTWEGKTPHGNPIALTLAIKGTVVTGTLLRSGQSAPLIDGKASKTTFTFKATLNDQTEGFSGGLAGDDIKIWMDRQGPSNAIVLRRARRK